MFQSNTWTGPKNSRPFCPPKKWTFDILLMGPELQAEVPVTLDSEDAKRCVCNELGLGPALFQSELFQAAAFPQVEWKKPSRIGAANPLALPPLVRSTKLDFARPVKRWPSRCRCRGPNGSFEWTSGP